MLNSLKSSALLVAGALLLGPGLSLAADSSDGKSEPATQSVGQAGMRAYIDPASGQLVSQPITDEQKRIAATPDPGFSEESAGLQVVVFADGSSMVDLQGRYQVAVTAERMPDGSLRTYCNEASHAALAKHYHDADGTTVVVGQREER